MRPAEIEIVRHAFASIPEEMGLALRRSAYSPNIKERMDASCALFDADGRLVAQAEHIPVHLGSMPLAVSVLREEFEGRLRDGDQWFLNDPYRGGSHLPDITVLKPVFCRGSMLGFTVNKAHHADVGGSAPGSMPADSRVLEDEGVVIEPQVLLDRGRERRAALHLVEGGMRNPIERRGDLRAQVAANELGARRFLELVGKHGVARVQEFESELLAYSERRVRAAIRGLPLGTWNAEDALEAPESDVDLTIAAAITVGRGGISVDFDGTTPQFEGNLNAPYSVTLSAVYYALRCVTDPHVPSNAGCTAPIAVDAPLGSLVNPRSPAAVAAGNVETSQRIVDVLFLALAAALPSEVPAQSQGTMNNLLIGGRRRGREFTYYETIAGGEGALPYRNGQGGIHTHMTNTRNTPVEALELAYPLRIVEYRLIADTGGTGRHRGGDGVRRVVSLLAPATVSIVSDRRRHLPKGLAGGGDGRPGRNLLFRAGRGHALPAKVTFQGRFRDRVVIETPGGGGWGDAAGASSSPAAGRGLEPALESDADLRPE